VLALRPVRTLAAQELREGIEANQNHASVVVWSLGNELNSRPGPAEEAWFATGAALARELDPSRPVAYVFAGYPTAPCQPEYAPVDIIGVNSYFGWYTGDGGELSDRRRLSGYLDQLRACYPDKALMVTEFGAEANRDGPVEEKGTFAFQQDFVRYHLGVYATKPWLSGVLYWALNEFRVKPQWAGGNPRPASPIHQKGLIAYDRERKPAYADVQGSFRATRQYTGGD
jgi:beta-glucuronidase